MSALSDSRHTEVEAVTAPRKLLVGTDVVYKGGLVMHDDGASTIVAAADTAGGRLAGLCDEEVDNSAGGTKYATVLPGILVHMAGSGFAAGDEGKPVWVTDDQTVSTTIADVPVGVIVEVVSSTEVVVDLAAGRVLTALRTLQQSHVSDPSGGTTVDAEARTAINSILDILEAFGFMATS